MILSACHHRDGVEGVEGVELAVKTVIAFHQVGLIFSSSLKQSNLQRDNYALAPFYLLSESAGRV